VVRHGILIAVKHKAVHCVAVLRLGYGGLRRVAAGSDPVGASFPEVRSALQFANQESSRNSIHYRTASIALFNPLVISL